MKRFLDTDTISLMERGNDAVQRRLLEHEPSDVFITVITVYEQIDGRFKTIQSARTPQATALAYQQLAQTFLYLRDLPIADYSEAAVLRFDSLLKMKLNVGKNDLRIAAIALEADGVVVTRNLRDFMRVPGLVCEDWAD